MPARSSRRRRRSTGGRSSTRASCMPSDLPVLLESGQTGECDGGAVAGGGGAEVFCCGVISASPRIGDVISSS